MKNSKYKRILSGLLLIIAILLLVFVIILFLGDGKEFPNWDTVLEIFELSPSQEYAYDADYFRVVDVGQGDCLMFYSNGKTALIDTGPPEYSYVLPSRLDTAGIDEIDIMIFTHYHSDHTGGIEEIMGKYEVKNLLLPDVRIDEEGYEPVKQLRESVQLNSGGIYTAVPGLSVQVGEFEITVIGYYNGQANENDRSIVLMAKIDDVKILLMADAEKNTENLLIDQGIDLSCDILKVGHHGSNTSTSERFLNSCEPEYAVVSCGKDNTFSHPHDDVISRLERIDTKFYRTDLQGDITFLIEENKITVKKQK